MLPYESRYMCVVIYIYGNRLGLAAIIVNEKERVKGTEIEKQENELRRHIESDS